MNKFAERILRDVAKGENIDLLFLTFLCIVLFILDVIGFSLDKYIISIALATLGIFSFSLLATRQRIEDISGALNVTDAITLQESKPELYFEKMMSLDDVWMLGLMLRLTTEEYYHQFVHRANSGNTVRVLISNYENLDMDQLVKRFSQPGYSPDHFEMGFRDVLRQYSEIRRLVDRPERIQIRLIDHVPPYSLYIFPKSKGNGTIIVELYGYKRSDSKFPKFVVGERTHYDWYTYFISQYELLWENAKEYSFDDE